MQEWIDYEDEALWHAYDSFENRVKENTPFTTNAKFEQGSGGNLGLKARVYTSSRSFSQALGASLSGRAAFDGATVSGSAALSRKISMDATTIVLLAEVDALGMHKLIDLKAPRKLTQEAADLLKKGGKPFYDVYGDGYVTGIAYGVSLVIAFSLQTTSLQEKTEVAAKLHGEFGEGTFSVDAEFKAKLQNAAKKHSMQFDYHFAGGRGASIPKGDDLTAEALLEAALDLARRVDNGNKDVCGPFQVKVTPYTDVPALAEQLKWARTIGSRLDAWGGDLARYRDSKMLDDYLARHARTDARHKKARDLGSGLAHDIAAIEKCRAAQLAQLPEVLPDPTDVKSPLSYEQALEDLAGGDPVPSGAQVLLSTVDGNQKEVFIDKVDKSKGPQYYPRTSTEGKQQLKIKLKNGSGPIVDGSEVVIETPQDLEGYDQLGAWDTHALYYYTANNDESKQTWIIHLVDNQWGAGTHISDGDEVDLKVKHEYGKVHLAPSVEEPSYLTTYAQPCVWRIRVVNAK